MRKLILPSAEIFPSLNVLIDLAKKHWAAYSKEKAKLNLLVKSFASKLRPVEQYPVTLKFTWIMSNARRDPGNIAGAGEKIITDGLIAAGVLEGDRWKHVKSIQHFFILDKENPRIEVKIY